MANVAFVIHPERPEAVALAGRVGTWLRERGHQVRVAEGHAEPFVADTATDDDIELAVSFGGDGTMLRAVELASPAGVPVLGVNLGHLGYLTEVEPAGLQAALERFLAGDYGVEERMTLQVVVHRAASAADDEDRRVPPTRSLVALNEMVVEKPVPPGYAVRLAASIADRPFLTYAADGILVATPTGSTAYNLSARGPIVSPHLRAIIVTPVSPHMLFDRPLVLGPSETFRLELLSGSSAVLVVDGSCVEHLEPGDAVVCRAGPHPARLVTFGRRDFHSILKAKFNLTDR
ncbi:MAG TPA: NAD(+)/NADH kinase [Acidimicrobiales bacterium]|jgi:NAD+ kinase|nr:NAD(+)/NADH kinase [Acidimicrobiales bacterium]